MTATESAVRPLLETLHHHPGHLIRRLQQIAVSIFLQETGSFGATPVQYAALHAIAATPGLDQQQLSHNIAYDRSTIGDVVDRLERRSLIERRTSLADRRSKSLHLTAQGADLLAAIGAPVERVQAAILQPLDAAERQTFLALLARLVDANNGRSRSPLV